MKKMKRIVSLLCFMYGALLLLSCNNNDVPIPVPEPDPEEVYVLKFKSSDIMELKKIEGNKTIDIAKGEAIYFL